MLIRFAILLVSLAAAHSLMGGSAAGRTSCAPQMAAVVQAQVA